MNEFIKEGDHIVLNVPYAEAYIPKDLFGDPEKGNPTAYLYGQGIRTVGLFNMRFFDSEDVVDRNSVELRTFNYPSVITMYPTEYITETLQLSPDMEEDTYQVLQFVKGDIIMETKTQKRSQNCEEFMNFLIRGKLPKGLKYTDLYFAWQKNFKINSVNPGVPAITLQTIISENCRSKDDAMKQFRKVVENDKVSMSDYRVHNMVNICSNSSVLNALTFERFGDMLTYALNMSKNDVKQNKTPLEEVLTM